MLASDTGTIMKGPDLSLPERPDAPTFAPVALELAGLALLFAIHFWAVKATNMGGFEWPNLHLASRGIISYPHANRPLTLAWFLPATLARPHDLEAFLVCEWIYLLAGAAMLHLLVRRCAPAQPSLAFLAAAFVLTWAPMDHARLQATVIIGYAGTTLAALVVAGIWLRAWTGDRPALLGLAVVLAIGLSRVAEAVLPLLMGIPILALASSRRPRRPGLWLAAWFGPLLLNLVFLAARLQGQKDSYQAGLGFDPHPGRILSRLGLQLWYQFSPLGSVDLRELAEPAVPLAALVLLGLWWRHTRTWPSPVKHPREALAAVGMGLAFACLGYSAFVAAASFVTPVRTQILSGPGAAVALAGAVILVAGLTPPRLRRWVVGALGAWIVALGTARTLAMQHDWDRHGRFPAQRALLAELVRVVPDVAPHTTFVLFDEGQTFPAVFAFRHAIEYLYARRATGIALGVPDLFYPYQFGPDGLRIEPAPAIRGPWEDEPTVYRHDEIVVLERRRDSLRVLEDWPPALPPLPAGARYAPRERIRLADPGLPSRRVLRER